MKPSDFLAWVDSLPDANMRCRILRTALEDAMDGLEFPVSFEFNLEDLHNDVLRGRPIEGAPFGEDMLIA